MPFGFTLRLIQKNICLLAHERPAFYVWRCHVQSLLSGPGPFMIDQSFMSGVAMFSLLCLDLARRPFGRHSYFIFVDVVMPFWLS